MAVAISAARQQFMLGYTGSPFIKSQYYLAL
jgi:hypothetical protein